MHSMLIIMSVNMHSMLIIMSVNMHSMLIIMSVNMHSMLVYKYIKLDNKCKYDVTIIDKRYRRFWNISIKMDHDLHYIESTSLLLNPIELDNLLHGYEDKIMNILYMQLLSHNITVELLEHICNKPIYNEHITLLDSYVNYHIAHRLSYNTLQYFSYKYMIRMYEETKNDKLLEYISKRDDIPIDMQLLISKRNFNTTIRLLSVMNNVSIILYDEYDDYQYLELFKLVRTGKYYINVVYNSSSIPNLLLQLEISDNHDSIYSLSCRTPIRLIKYCSRLFPLGLYRFYNNYVRNGSKSLRYYYRIHMHNTFKDYYQQYPSDINIITYR